jgi:hypothetical protein
VVCGVWCVVWVIDAEEGEGEEEQEEQDADDTP